MREYLKDIPDYAHVITRGEWFDYIDNGFLLPEDGHGYWCKDGKQSTSQIFCTVPKDATHVAWYNK
jgi:hypothetical protein